MNHLPLYTFGIRFVNKANMPAKSLFTLLFLLVFNLLTASAQSAEDYSQLTGLYLVSEDNQINVHGLTTMEMTINFRKSAVYKIINQKGIDYLKNYPLPQSYDSSFQRHAPAVKNNVEVYGDVQVNLFEVSKTVGGNEFKVPLEKESEIVLKSVESNRYQRFKQYTYRLKDLEVGDLVKVNYKYQMPYNMNILDLLSFRIFFHGTLYKKNYSLKISYPKNLGLNIHYQNNGRPDTLIQKGNRKVQSWQFKNLPPALRENAARPYLSLPHIVTNIKAINFTYYLQASTREVDLPNYALFAYSREYDHLKVVTAIDQGVTFRQFNLMNSYFKAQTEDIENDSTSYFKLKAITNSIADEISFIDDRDYFLENDNFNMHYGSNLQSGKISAVENYMIYIAMIRKLKLAYFTAYASDIRSGVTDRKHLQNMNDNNYFLTPMTWDRSLQVVFPKFHDFGYYLNEYPFYYENASTRLIHMGDYRAERSDIDARQRKFIFPASEFKDNYRKTNVMGNLNIAEETVDFKSRVTLSGQYSTMTRGFYKNNYVDETVSQDYHRHVWDLNGKTTVNKKKLKQLSDVYPFKAQLNAEYQVADLIVKQTNTVRLNIGGMVRHILNEHICDSPRFLDYYPDFLGSDTYAYLLKTDQAVKLHNPPKEINLENEFGQYKYKIDQVDPKTIRISSYFTTIKSQVAAADISQVCTLYEAIQKQKSAVIKMTLLN